MYGDKALLDAAPAGPVFPLAPVSTWTLSSSSNQPVLGASIGLSNIASIAFISFSLLFCISAV